MNRQMLRWLGHSIATSLFLFSLVATVSAQCPTATPITTGLRHPLGAAFTNQGNVLVSETGTTTLHSGRISIVDDAGNRRTLLDGLPSAINDVNEPSGPAGIFMRGRTLYVAMGTGDAGRPGPSAGTTIPNPNPISSPIFSSVLGIQFSANTEDTTPGFTLNTTDQQSLANGETVVLSDGAGGTMKIRLIADFPNFISNPIPTFSGNVRLSNPFDLVPVDDVLYVTDGGRNLVWQVDLLTGSSSSLIAFPPIPNPFFGMPLPGGPFLDAVPTGIAAVDNKLLVTLFRGVPFPPNTSTVQEIDLAAISQSALISGRKTAIDILPLTEDGDSDHLVLQHASLGPFFGSAGLVLHFENPTDSPTVVTNCLVRPTSMVMAQHTSTLYVTEFGGRVVKVPMN